MQLADLGAEVIKVENPGGDYVRKMAFPIIDGISLLHWHLNRGKQEHRARPAHRRRASRRISTWCAAPTRSSRRCGPARWRGAASATSGCARSNPRIVFCTHLGLRHDRPVQGHAEPRHRLRRLGRRRAADVQRRRPADHPDATPPSASTPARSTPRSASARRSSARAPPGAGCRFEVAQSDAAAAFNWNGIEGNKAYERPEDEVTGNDGDGKGAAPPGRRQQHEGVGALPVLPLAGRHRPLHGLGARVLEELLPTASAARSSTTQQPGRASTPTTRAATSRCAASWPTIFATRTTAEWIALRPAR